MKQNKKLLCVLLSIIFLTVPMGIAAFSPTGSTSTIADAAIPAAEYDFANRKEPINVLVYNEYADMDEEYANTMSELRNGYGYTFEYENLTDYTQLAGMIDDYDVLLLIEQEAATFAQMDAVAAAWDGFLQGWVDDGGVLICMAHWSQPELEYHGTARILNNTGLMRVYNSTGRIGASVTITNSFDPLAFGVSAFTGPSGTSSFDTPDGDAIFSTSGQTVVAHRYFGLGHVVMLGFDMYAINPNTQTILANAVRLTRLAVFDNAHNQYWDPYAGYNTFATYIQENYGFAIATMNTWDETIVQSSQVFVAGISTSSPAPYSTNEVNFVSNFVAGGGGLLIFTDVWSFGNSTDPLLAEFGFARNQTIAFVGDTDDNEGNANQPIFGSDNIANHSATISVTSIQMMGPTAFTTIPAEATPLIWTDSDGTAEWSTGGDASGLTVAASLHHGAGRIVAISDGDFLTDYDNDGDTIDFYDHSNEEFASNVMIWLSAAGIQENTVLFDESKNPYYSLQGAFTEFGRFLTFNGFNMRWMSQFSSIMVEEADVMVLVDGSVNHTTQEIATYVEFVSQGGGLFSISDQLSLSTQNWNIAIEFGLNLNTTGGHIVESDDYQSSGAYTIWEGSKIANHPIMTGVHRMELDLSNGFASIGTGVSLLTTDTDGTATWSNGGVASGVSTIAATTHGFGRVIGLCDLNLPDDADPDGDGFGYLYDSDNDVFLANAFYWLIENRAPTVEVLFPNGGELLNGTHMVEWTAEDPNRDELRFNLFLSDNNGSDWVALASDITGFTYSWNTTQHDDGNSYLIRVVAFDGILTDQDESDNPFELDNFAPGGLPIDPLLLAVIGVGVVLVVIVLVFLMKKKGGGKKK